MSFCDEISDVIVVSSQYNNYDQPIYATLTPMKPSQFIFNEISSTSSIESQNSSSQQLTPNNLNMNYTNEEMEEDEPENDFNERNSGQNGEPCLVCGGVAKGLHFQVNSCRACAAFFRRSTKSKLVYRCQRGTGRCDLTVKVKGKPLCRYCRMKKCTSVGMRIESENIPSLESNNSGSISSSPTEPSPLENWNKNFGRSEVRIEGKRVIYDSQPLVSVIKESLQQNRSNMGNLPSGITLTPMQKMNAAVTKFMTSLTPKIGEIQVVTEIGVDCGMKFLEEYLLKLTEMVTSCNYFTSLPDSDKWLIFKRFWSTFHQIERAYQTIQVFGNEINDYRILIDDKKAVDMDVAKLKFMEFNTEIGNILKIFEPIKDRVFQHLLNPMKQLRPTNYELTYMAQHALWSCFEINGLLPSTYRIAEEVTERNANELHNYYVYEMHISNYASRHAALLKLVAVSDFIIRSKKDMMIMAKVFDILENDFFESELMQ